MINTKKSIFKYITAVLFAFTLLFAGTRDSHAQLGDAGEILRAGAADANLLMENYLKPFSSGFGASLNSGWFNTARPYRTLGFDLRINVGVALVPDVDQLFDVTALTFQELQILGGPTDSPTMFGDNVTGTTLGKTFDNPATGQTETLFSFDMPPGIGFPYVPAPMAQLTVGVIKDTDITLRYLPTYEIEDISVGMFGIGVKHGINQWLPGGGMLPVDISIQAGFTKLTAEIPFDVQPDVDAQTQNNFPATTWDGQAAEFEATGFTANVLVGKNLPFIAVFGGVGMQTSTTSIITPGSYPITIPNAGYDPMDPDSRPKIVDKIDDPLNLELEGENNLHALAGFRLRLGILAISGSYTLAKYPVASVGVGLSFR